VDGHRAPASRRTDDTHRRIGAAEEHVAINRLLADMLGLAN